MVQSALNTSVESSQFSVSSYGGAFDSLGELEKAPYDETRPRLACFTRHSEFFKESCRPGHLKTEVATWTLGLRAQTPAFDARIGHPLLHSRQLRHGDFDKGIRGTRQEA